MKFLTQIKSRIEVMTRRALLLGLNYRSTSHELRGCIRDVYNLEIELASKYKFTDIRILTDDTLTQPTSTNFTRALQNLTSACETGDLVFISYSGHGSLVRDASGDEISGKDSSLFMLDGVFYLDDLLRERLSDFKAGVRVIVLLDCCHSGTCADMRYCLVNKSEYLGTSRRDRPPKEIPVFTMSRGRTVVSTTEAVRKAKRMHRPSAPKRNCAPLIPPKSQLISAFIESDWSDDIEHIVYNYPETKADIIVLSACYDAETASEDYSRGIDDVQGAFTRAFIDSLRAKKHTIGSLLKMLSCTLLMRDFRQTPHISTGREMDLSDDFWLN